MSKRVAIIVSSDAGYRGEREDKSGPEIKRIVEENGYEVVIVDNLCNSKINVLDRIEISGNSEASQELRKRWSRVVQHLKNNKELMYSEVKKIMLAPNGRSINIETIKNFIDITEQDSVKKITLNPDFLLDELLLIFCALFFTELCSMLFDEQRGHSITHIQLCEMVISRNIVGQDFSELSFASDRRTMT